MIEIEKNGGSLCLTISRPERRNALTNAMYKELDMALQTAQDDPQCSSVLISGAGGTFTSGNDLAEFQSARGLTDSPALAFLRTLAAIDVPLIAAVEGQAIGVGVTLLQHCDFVYAGDSAIFRMPFVSLGLCPEGGSSLLMAQLVGARRTAEWLLLGTPFSAAQAYESGFITAVSPAGHAMVDAQATASALAQQPAQALRVSKQLLRMGNRAALDAAFNTERDRFSERVQSEEAQNAFKVFFERKKS